VAKLVGPALTFAAVALSAVVASRLAHDGIYWCIGLVVLTVVATGLVLGPDEPRPIVAPDGIDRFFLAIAQLAALVLSPYRFARGYWRFAARRPVIAAVLAAGWLGLSIAVYAFGAARVSS
jgi:hypothetical protein